MCIGTEMVPVMVQLIPGGLAGNEGTIPDHYRAIISNVLYMYLHLPQEKLLSGGAVELATTKRFIGLTKN